MWYLVAQKKCHKLSTNNILLLPYIYIYILITENFEIRKYVVFDRPKICHKLSRCKCKTHCREPKEKKRKEKKNPTLGF